VRVWRVCCLVVCCGSLVALVCEKLFILGLSSLASHNLNYERRIVSAVMWI
jgi:hypothetical protein